MRRAGRRQRRSRHRPEAASEVLRCAPQDKGPVPGGRSDEVRESASAHVSPSFVSYGRRDAAVGGCTDRETLKPWR